MAFYLFDNAVDELKRYEQMLQTIGSLSRMFSENNSPYLDSRITENLFCRYLNAINLARGDITADAKKGSVGIGIKTWMGGASQKIAEFDAERRNYESLASLEEKVKYIANLRNERISMTMRSNGLDSMVYHCTLRYPSKITIQECPLLPIDIDSIHDIKDAGRSFSFSDKYNRYSFNYAKSTLFKNFEDLVLLREIPVEILEDPFEVLDSLLVKKDETSGLPELVSSKPYVEYESATEKLIDRAYLPLYSFTKKAGKFVPPKNNLNMRMAGGRKRDIYEVGIPIPAAFRAFHPDFFPGIERPFRLLLPDGKELIAKQCQQNGKALMSNPNSALGHWLIDTVFQIDPELPFTYSLLAKYGIDSVELSKVLDKESQEIFYRISFALCGSYERYIGTTADEEE